MTRGPADRPVLVPDLPFPPYAFVPGRFPHPTADPAGHSFGIPSGPFAVPDPERWQECFAYLRGIDLFNHGFYWEAHEAWEGLWHACGRHGRIADFLKGLIQLAAAGVKVREGQAAGVRGHAHRAAELFRDVASGSADRHLMGLSLDDLATWAEEVGRQPPAMSRPNALVEIVFRFVLRPQG